jgi:hypothetical protein
VMPRAPHARRTYRSEVCKRAPALTAVTRICASAQPTPEPAKVVRCRSMNFRVSSAPGLGRCGRAARSAARPLGRPAPSCNSPTTTLQVRTRCCERNRTRRASRFRR